MDGYYQSAWMVNYPEAEFPWTRIAEYKHMPNQPQKALESKGTVIYREYSTDIGDPYYPVPNERNRALYRWSISNSIIFTTWFQFKDFHRKYQQFALNEENVVFVGRLASYKYFNMDQVNSTYVFQFVNTQNNF